MSVAAAGERALFATKEHRRHARVRHRRAPAPYHLTVFGPAGVGKTLSARRFAH